MSVGNFAVLALVDSTYATTILLPMWISRNKVRVGPHWSQIDPKPNVESRLQAILEEHPWGYFPFWHFCGYAKSPILGPQFQPPHVVYWRPYFSKCTSSRNLIPSFTLRYESEVPPPNPWAMGPTLATPATHGNHPNFAYFCHLCTQIGVSLPLESV